jgi:hypothetical protein
MDVTTHMHPLTCIQLLSLGTLNQKSEGSYTISKFRKNGLNYPRHVMKLRLYFPLRPLLAITLDTPLSFGLIQPPSLVHVLLVAAITFLLLKY